MIVTINNGQIISMRDFLEDNLSAWLSMRINGASASMIDSPYIEPELIKAFDEAAEKLKKSIRNQCENLIDNDCSYQDCLYNDGVRDCIRILKK